jgi:hypothetical protein
MIRQLNPISWSQFNDGDTFVLNAVEYVFVWIGQKANKLEKFHAAKVCNITDYVFTFFLTGSQFLANCFQKKSSKYTIFFTASLLFRIQYQRISVTNFTPIFNA